MTTARELRFAFTFDDYDEALRVFRDVLGLDLIEVFTHQPGRGAILRVPNATLEIFDGEHTGFVGRVETGSATQERARIAVRVDDIDQTGTVLEAMGVDPFAEAVETPWGDHNRRYGLGDGFPLTLFEAAKG